MPHTHLDFVRTYLSAIEAGATGERLAAFFTADVVQEEFPNRLLPTGARRDLAELLAGAVKGQQILSAQHFEILTSVESGDTVALEIAWTGTLSVALGTIPADAGALRRVHPHQGRQDRPSG